MSESEPVDAKLHDRLSAAASAVETPSAGKTSYDTAVRKAVWAIQQAGEDGVSASKIRTIAKGEDPLLDMDWLKTVLPWFPGIYEERAGVWCFSRTDAERDPPAVPDDPRRPTDEQVNQWVQASDFPGGGTRPAKHRTAVREAYRTLVEQGTATRDDLRADANVSNYDNPEQGHFVDREQWWRHCGRPALADLPDEHPFAARDSGGMDAGKVPQCWPPTVSPPLFPSTK
jgi:hypothetical protein